MKDENAILYVQTSNEPDAPVLPAGARAVGQGDGPQAHGLLPGHGPAVLRPGEAEKIQMGIVPERREMLDKTMAMGIPILVCEASKQMLGWETVELIDGVKIVGAATLNDLALDAGATMWF